MKIIGKTKTQSKWMKDGTHAVVIEKIEDASVVDNTKAEGESIAITYRFEQVNEDGSQYFHTETYKNLLLGTAKLPRVLEAILGRKLTDDEQDEGVDTEAIQGKKCKLKIEVNGRDKKGNRKIEVKKVQPENALGAEIMIPEDEPSVPASKPAPAVLA